MSVNVYDSVRDELNPLTSAFANLPIIDVATLPSQYLVDAIYRVASDNWVFSSVELSASDMTENVTNLEAIGFATNVDGDEYTFTPATSNIRYLHNDVDYSISSLTINSVTGEMNIYNTALEPLFIGVISTGALYPFYYSEKWSVVNILLSHTDMDANTEAFTNNGFTSSTDNVHFTYIPAAKRFKYDGHQISKIIVTSTDGNMKMYDEHDEIIYNAVIVDGAYTFTSASAVTYWVGNKAKQTADQLAKIDDIRSFNSVSSLQDIFNSNPAQVVSGNNNNMMFVDDSGNKYIGVSKDGVNFHNTNQNVNITPADIEVSHQVSGSKVTDFKVNATKITMSNVVKEALKTDLDIYDVESMVTGIETDATSASKAYAIGDLLILGDVLYKVKAAIAATDPLVVGTNIESITVEEWVNELLGDRDDVIEQIEKDITGLENGSTSSKAYAVNDLLIRNDVLYKVTDAIAIGDSFTVGTNISAVTIEDLLKLKQNKILDTPLKIDSTTTNATTVEGALGLLNQKKLNVSLKGAAEGLAELNANGKVPASQLPSYVDDVIEGYYNEADGKFYEHLTASFDPVTPVGTEDPLEEGWYEEDGAGGYIPTSDTTVDPSKTYYEEVWTYSDEITGETGKIYIDLSTEKSYRWSGTVFVNIGSSLALGETSDTAYRGDRGKIAYDDSQTNKAAIAKILADIASVDAETATTAHAIDDLVLVNNQLYKVTTAISIGDTIAAGTNVVTITLEEALQNKLDSWSTLPTASAIYLGKIVHYKGADTATLVQGYIYKCVSETDETTGDITYKWEPTINLVIDDELDDESVNPVQNKVVKEAIDKKQDYIFRGTHAEWEALTTEQKAIYDLVAFTDDLCADGDAYISGTVAEGDYNAVSSDAVYNELYGRKFIIMADSYGNYKDADNKNFIDLTRERLGFTTDNFIDLHIGSAGFTRTGNTKFLTMLQNLDVDRSSVTDIIVFAGANDVLADYNTNVNAIAEFATWVEANMPKAKVRIGHPGLTFDINNMTARLKGSLLAYRNCDRNKNMNYIKNSEYVLCSSALLMSDNVHPTAEGVNQLSIQLCKAIKNGECDVHYYHEEICQAGSWNTGYITSVGGLSFWHLNNGQFSIGGNGAGNFANIKFNTPVNLTGTMSKVLTVSDSYSGGSESNWVCPRCSFCCIHSNGTRDTVPGSLWFHGTYDSNHRAEIGLVCYDYVSAHLTDVIELAIWLFGESYPTDI